MAVEIEAKMKVSDLESVREKLTTLGAAKVGEFFEINTFFDTEDRSLLAADHGLRLRAARNLVDNTQTFRYTFKGARQHGVLKSREEIELDVGDHRTAERFLLALGFQKVLSFEKRRHTWKLEGCSVELDELPHLGVYVEIEGTDEQTILRIRDQLGLQKAPLIKTSYVAMLMGYLQDNGTHTRSVTFGS